MLKGKLTSPKIWLISCALLHGCATHTTLPVETSGNRQVPVWYLEHSEIKTESQAWYMPWKRVEFLYGVAEDVSPSMEMALKKAILKAKSKIADRVNGEIDRRTTMSYLEDGSPGAPQAAIHTFDEINNAIRKLALGKYNTEKREIIFNPETGNYRAFIVLKVRSADLADALKVGK